MGILRMRMAIGGWNPASYMLFIVLFVTYIGIFSAIDHFLLSLGIFTIVLPLIFAITTGYFIEKRLGLLEEGGQFRKFEEGDRKERVEKINQMIDTSKCMSCQAELDPNNSICPNCGFDYQKKIHH